MWDFLLVLGQIPGTHIQITFLEFIIALVLVITVWLLRKKLLSLKTIVRARHFVHYLHLYFRTKKGQQLKLPV